MGGFIGLLLGASVLTIFEIIDLFVYNAFAKYCCRRVAPNRSSAWAWQSSYQTSARSFIEPLLLFSVDFKILVESVTPNDDAIPLFDALGVILTN